MTKPLTVYYVHPMALYHSSIECLDLSDLRAMGFEVVNPALLKYRTYEMSDFVKLACSCDVLAFRAFDDGKIGSGMALEIEAARAKDIPIFEMPDSSLKGRYLSRNETRARMALPPLRCPDTAPIRTVSDGGDFVDYSDPVWS